LVRNGIGAVSAVFVLSYVYRSAKFDAKFINFFRSLVYFMKPFTDVQNFSDRK